MKCFINPIVNSNAESDTVKNLLPFMIELFKFKNIKLVTFFMCWNNSGIHHIQQNMWAADLRTSYISPFNYLFSTSLNYLKLGYFKNQGCVLDFSCSYSTDFLRNISDENKFQATKKWLILCPESRKKTARNILESLHIRLDSDITLAISNERQTQFILQDMYKIGGQARISFFGIWHKNSSATSLQIFSNISGYTERMDMSDVHLSATTVVTRNLSEPLEEYLLRREVVNHDSMTKIFYALFIHLKDVHNFSYTLKCTNAWYGSSKGGNDGGLSRELSDGLTDIAASGATMTKERVVFIDYSIAIFHFRTYFVFRDKGIFKNEFIHAFSMKAWLGLLAMVAAISLSIKCTYSYRRSKECSFPEACIITLEGLCLQGSTYRPGNIKSKCVLLSLLLMSAVLYNYYSTVIVSKLLNSRPRAITTLKALVESDIKLGAEDIIYLHQIFKIRNNSDMQKLYKKLQVQHGKSAKLCLFSVEEGIRRVQEEHFAYHSEAEKIYPVVSRTFEPPEICDLSEVCIYNTTAYFMWKKNSEYKNLFSVSYRRMIENGLLQRQRFVWQAKKPPCISKGNFVNVGMERTSLAFFLIVTGIGIAFILLLLEIMYHKLITCK